MADALSVITGRRSVSHLTDAPVPREVVARLIDAAIHAPNHKLTQPWHFYVFEGAARERLARALVENYRLDNPQADVAELEGPGQKSARRVLAAPLTIVVTSDAGRDEIETLENFAAVAAATQNLLLAAHALGLGATWRTGQAAYTAPRNAIKELIGIAPEARIVGLVIVGYPVPDSPIKQRPRIPGEEKTTWMA